MSTNLPPCRVLPPQRRRRRRHRLVQAARARQSIGGIHDGHQDMTARRANCRAESPTEPLRRSGAHMGGLVRICGDWCAYAKWCAYAGTACHSHLRRSPRRRRPPSTCALYRTPASAEYTERRGAAHGERLRTEQGGCVRASRCREHGSSAAQRRSGAQPRRCAVAAMQAGVPCAPARRWHAARRLRESIWADVSPLSPLPQPTGCS